MEQREHVRCLIVGSGPAGYTAAIYASRANLHPVEYCGMQPGGQLTQTTTVENFPGYPGGVDGNQMMMEMRQQAEAFGADLRDGVIVKADLSKAPYVLTTDSGKEIEADTVIIATGASAKYLGLEDEKKYNGMGVSACATCDGFFYRKKDVAVVGGGNVAMDAARCSKRLGAEVYVVYRRGMEELPARHEEVEHAIEEGVIFKTLNNPVQINGDEQDCVKSMTCIEMELGEPDASGRRRPDGTIAQSTSATGYRQRDQTADKSKRSHQNRTQTAGCPLDGRSHNANAFLAALVRHLDNQDRILT